MQDSIIIITNIYQKLKVETQAKYAQINALLNEENHTQSEDAMLAKLQSEYSAFVSADYMMSKNLPFWGESPQPAKTYYQMKLVCDVFGIVNHSKRIERATTPTFVMSLQLGQKRQTTLFLFSNTSLITTLTAGFEISHFALIMPECVRTNI